MFDHTARMLLPTDCVGILGAAIQSPHTLMRKLCIGWGMCRVDMVDEAVEMSQPLSDLHWRAKKW
jgi:hypothetical protein